MLSIKDVSLRGELQKVSQMCQAGGEGVCTQKMEREARGRGGTPRITKQKSYQDGLAYRGKNGACFLADLMFSIPIFSTSAF